MNKIPTVFQRDWEGDRSRVLEEPTPSCEWVFAGEGVATRKYDGSSCAMIDGLFYRRQEVKLKKVRADRAKREGQLREMVLGVVPAGFIEVERTVVPGYESMPELVGWVPVGDGPEDRWHREAWTNAHTLPERPDVNVGLLPDGTYELCGPKIQGNPEGFDRHVLVRHDAAERIDGVVPTYDGIRDALEANDVEGIVWHHPDGRMAKIKARDYGIKRGQQ